MHLQSYVCGCSDVPLSYRTAAGALQDAQQAWGEREALVVRHQNVRWTYAELAERVESLACGLIELGLARGDRIGIWAPNCAEWVLTQFAAARAGLVLVNINPAYRISELEYALNKVGVRALVTASGFKGTSYLDIIRTLMPESASAAGPRPSPRLPALELLIQLGASPAPGFLAFDRLLGSAGASARAELAHRECGMTPDDAVNIQFTSGTTGHPKGATLTHFNIVNNGYFVARRMRFSSRDRLCIPVPLYHCFGMVMGVLGCVTHGAAMVFPSESFDAGATLAAIEAERATALYGVPTMFVAELDHPEFARFELASLRTGVMAGSPCPIEVMKRVVAEMHMPEVTICYGMTETSPVSLQSEVDDPIERRVSTVGRIHPHVEVKIVDEAGQVVPRGAAGQLLTRGYSVMRGYWADPDRTREAIDAGGWMHTGDLASMDAAGYVNIVGRVKDMIIRGGENIYPREIEELLYRHPKVADVQVFGVPDAHYGEVVCAWIKLRADTQATADEIVEFCRASIARYKVPRHVRFVDGFPMTVTGKIQKYLMRQQMASELQLDEQRTA
jgi:fatty-acyl-CoA synthase